MRMSSSGSFGLARPWSREIKEKLTSSSRSLQPARHRNSVMRLRYLAVFALFALFLWLSFGAPIPMASMEPMKPDARIPTFQQSVANKSELQQRSEEHMSELQSHSDL